MILIDLRDKLLEIDEHVFYGMVDDTMREMVWNYIVFERSKISFNANKSGISYYFTIHIVRENFVPEGLEKTVIDKVCEIDGMRVTGEPSFQYVPKPNTNVVIEMLSIDFVLPMKG